MLRDTTSRGLCVRVWPPHTSECLYSGWRHGVSRTGSVFPKMNVCLQSLEVVQCMFITVGPMKKL